MADIKIPGLRKQRNSWFWEPSATLAREGWDRLTLGNDEGVAFVKARARNGEVEAWRAAGKPPRNKRVAPIDGITPLAVVVGGGITLARLIHEYQMAGYPSAKDEFKEIRDTSKDSYRYACDKLVAWAGDSPANLVSEDSAKLLYRALIKGKSKSSAYMVLAVARRVYKWGIRERRFGITVNPFAEIQASKPEPRRQLWDADRSGDHYEAFAAAAAALGRSELAMAIDLYLTLGQRTGDMCKVSSDNWRPINGLLRYQVEQLANNDGPNAGQVMGFHMVTKKTGAVVIIPVIGEKRRRIEAQIARNAARKEPVKALLVNEFTGRAWRPKTLQMRYADARAELVKTRPEFAGIQLRDLRRTAVVRMAEAGLAIPQIIAITGHSLEDATKILEHYMPRNVHMAISAVVAMAEHDAAHAEQLAAGKRAGIKLVA